MKMWRTMNKGPNGKLWSPKVNKNVDRVQYSAFNNVVSLQPPSSGEIRIVRMHAQSTQ